MPILLAHGPHRETQGYRDEFQSILLEMPVTYQQFLSGPTHQLLKVVLQLTVPLFL